MVEVADGISILDVQVQALLACGVRDICITTGAFAKKLEDYLTEKYSQVHFTFINNPIYDKTNYIYSIYLARDYSQQDILLIHGDLVFEVSVLQDLLETNTSTLVIDSTKPLPKKDFKATLRNGRISKVGVDIFEDALYTQPMYKLLKKDWLIWLDEIIRFCEDKRTDVYAEDALNSVSHNMNLYPLDILRRDCFEVDNKTDLELAKQFYIKHKQQVLTGYGSQKYIKDVLFATGAKKPMIICAERSNSTVPVANAVYFNGYTPNPKHEEALRGIELFEREKCDFLISIDGGSAIDTAKCINILNNRNELTLRESKRCRHLAVPTTAGTGSEATHFAVLYKDGEKYSIAHKDIIPEYVILDPSFLETLPQYYKKSAMLDALSQSIESLWANGATEESKEYALESIRLIEENKENYLNAKDEDSALNILKAAHLSGMAINIGKTTAAHAMSYGLTERFGLAHGHAVALCLVPVWAHLLRNDAAPEILSKEKLKEFVELFARLELNFIISSDEDVTKVASELVTSVNTERLSNHPMIISKSELMEMYLEILGEQ